MAVIGRAGNHLLTEIVLEDPFGTLYRGIALRDGRFHRHLLVRVFGVELRAAGLSSKLLSAHEELLRLGPVKAYERYHMEGGEEPFASSPYTGGRSLAAILAKIAAGATPMPMDSGLALLWSLSKELTKLRAQGFRHGLLNPHTVWVGFDGQVHLLDAPLAGVFRELLPRAPSLQAALRPYEPPSGLDEVRRDFWQLGALAYELLTRQHLPLAQDEWQSSRHEAVERLASGADGGEPLPGVLRDMLHRMLGTEGGFASIESFNQDMDRALFDGEHVPTTFGLAFYMHDIFLREANADAAAVKAEKEEDFFAHTEAAKRLQSRIQDNLSILTEASVARPRGRRTGMTLATGAAVLAVAGGFFLFGSPRQSQIETLKAQVMASEHRAAELSVQQSDLEHRDQEETLRQARMQQQLVEAKGAEAQAELRRQIQEARKRQAALEQQQIKLEAEQRRLMEARQAYERKAAPPAQTQPVSVEVSPAPILDESPRPLGFLSAGFPPGYRGEAEARVKVRVFISAEGRAQKAMVMDGDPALADIAKRTALAGTYTPARHGGSPVRDWVTVTIPFVR